jgi:hypothetical protein
MTPNDPDTARQPDRARFEEHLKRASLKVGTWPEWKQEMLGGFPHGHSIAQRSPEQNSSDSKGR